jgi:hypothetical protein
MTWTEEIVVAMRTLGGAARYADLYALIQQTTSRELTPKWRATVRRTIEDHSSDSANFRAEDIFEHVSHGHWKLRGVNVDESELVARENLTPSEVMARVFVHEHWRKPPSENDVNTPVAAWCDDAMLRVRLRDEREISTPLWWYPRLLSATHAERNSLELMQTGVHWPRLDEDLSVSGMLSGWKSPSAKWRAKE